MKAEKDAESAYGSDTSSKFGFTLKIDDGEKNKELKPWYKKPKFWIQLVLLAAFFLLLILILLNTIYQNERNFAMMTKLEIQIKNIGALLKNDVMVSNKTFEPVKTKIKHEQPIITSTHKEIRISTQTPPTTAIHPIQKTTRNPPKLANIKSPFFNVASFSSGARVYTGQSSSNVKSSVFSLDQSDYVIFEREPVPNKAWCTTDDSPYLTIDFHRGVKPIAVSYQHLKWNGTIPDGAPMVYDVVACYEKFCSVKVPLALNCKYESSGPQEQKCILPLTSYDYSLVYSVRFYFRKTYGNSKTTCAYLIRVFAEGTVEPPKSSKGTCSSLIWHRKNSPFLYNYILEKTCDVWYDNDCCAKCPECCTDNTAMKFARIIFCFSLIFALITATAGRRYNRNRKIERLGSGHIPMKK